MRLKDIHLEALHSHDFIDSKFNVLKDKVNSDATGSCWHKEQVLSYAQKQLEEYKLLSTEDKIKMPFFGLTVGLKDLFAVNGLKTTAGSRILEEFITPYDSHMWTVLKSKGALLGGKLAMDEFGMGSFSDTSSFGRVSLPSDPDRTAGGSSGGSGASLASGLFDFTIGSDTGGSVRLPASFCGTVGYKPSYGTYSRYGMIAYASSLDSAGILTKDIDDLIYITDADISQKDLKDTTCTGLTKIVKDKKSYIIAYMPHLIDHDGLSEDVKSAYIEEVSRIRSLGVNIKEIHLPIMDMAAQIYYIIACSEASSNLARYQGIYFGKRLIDEGFNGTFWEQTAQYRSKYLGDEVQKRITLGSFMLSSENFDAMYNKACKMRELLRHQLDGLLSTVDALILPAAPYVAPKWNQVKSMSSAQIYMSDFLTVPFSLAGCPAISMPGKKDSAGLNIGMQWISQKGTDFQLIKDIKDLA